MTNDVRKFDQCAPNILAQWSTKSLTVSEIIDSFRKSLQIPINDLASYSYIILWIIDRIVQKIEFLSSFEHSLKFFVLLHIILRNNNNNRARLRAMKFCPLFCLSFTTYIRLHLNSFSTIFLFYFNDNMRQLQAI